MASTLKGRKIGPYELLYKVAQGGMGIVYRAQQLGTGRDVAIKVLGEHTVPRGAFARRFEQEARVTTGLQHPHILPVLASGLDQGYPYLVMPYLGGGSLAGRLSQVPGGLPLAEVARITTQVAAALDYAHAHDVIHCDIKPGNVLFDESGNAYLADFGIAQLVSRAENDVKIAGTPPYAAPEMHGGGAPSIASDVYSLGVLVFEMLTGRYPFLEDDAASVLRVRDGANPVDVSVWRTDVPPGVSVVLAGALHIDPAARPVTAGSLAAALSRACERAVPAHKLDPLVWRTGPNGSVDDETLDGSPWEALLRRAGPHTPLPDEDPTTVSGLDTPPPEADLHQSGLPTAVNPRLQPTRFQRPPRLMRWLVGIALLAPLVSLFLALVVTVARGG